MSEDSLIINKGEYIISKQTAKGLLKAKLVVYYQQQKYNWRWLVKSYEGEECKQLADYLRDFAKRMIESKSHRNFYE